MRPLFCLFICYFETPAAGGMGSIAISTSACPSVRWYISETTCPVRTSQKFLCILHVAVARCPSDDNTIRCVHVLPVFVDDVVFSIVGVQQGLRSRDASQREAAQTGAEL